MQYLTPKRLDTVSAEIIITTKDVSFATKLDPEIVNLKRMGYNMGSYNKYENAMVQQYLATTFLGS